MRGLLIYAALALAVFSCTYGSGGRKGDSDGSSSGSGAGANPTTGTVAGTDSIRAGNDIIDGNNSRISTTPTDTTAAGDSLRQP